MRYIAEYIRQSTGTPALGTTNVLIRYYTSDRNAFRFMHQHLADGHFAAGQYRLSRWPVNEFDTVTIGTLYKKAEVH